MIIKGDLCQRTALALVRDEGAEGGLEIVLWWRPFTRPYVRPISIDEAFSHIACQYIYPFRRSGRNLRVE